MRKKTVITENCRRKTHQRRCSRTPSSSVDRVELLYVMIISETETVAEHMGQIKHTARKRRLTLYIQNLQMQKLSVRREIECATFVSSAESNGIIQMLLLKECRTNP